MSSWEGGQGSEDDSNGGERQGYRENKQGSKELSVYRDTNDWWIGWYRGEEHHYVCLIPTIVIRWKRSLGN
jgi:hypothetical protein